MEYVFKEKICEYCNQRFTKRGGRKFCSTECVRKYNLLIKNRCNIVRTIKKCRTCNIDFVGSNKTLYCSDICKVPKKDRLKVEAQRLKQELIDIKGGKCEQCGQVHDMAVFCFHHLDEKEKLFTLDQATLLLKKREDIFIEAQKCQLLCHNCHSAIHEKKREEKKKQTYMLSELNKSNKKRAKKKMLIELMGGKCMSCGFESEYLSTLSFDHLRDKKFDINFRTMYGKTDDELLEEVAKCDLLCMNCHIAKNSMENRQQSIAQMKFKPILSLT